MFWSMENLNDETPNPMTTSTEQEGPPEELAHEEDCPDPSERFGAHVTCPAELTERERHLLIALSDMHSRVSTLFAWGLSHAAATAVMEEAYEIFTIENSERKLRHKPPRKGTSARATNVVPEREGPPPGVGQVKTDG